MAEAIQAATRLQGMARNLLEVVDHPEVAAFDDGGYVVIWEGNTPDGYATDIHAADVFAQRFDAQGNPAGDMARLQGMAGHLFDGHPKVTALAGGGYVVTWQGYTSDGQRNETFVQRFDAQGAAAGSMARLQGMAGYLEDYGPQVTALDGGGYVVTWFGDTSDRGFDVFVQRFDAEGAAAGSMVRLNEGVGWLTQITALAGGGYVVTWSDRGRDIFVQRFDAQGDPAGSMAHLSGGTGGDLYPPIIALADGGYVVTWQGATSDGQALDIFVQRFDAQGAAAGSPARLQGMAGYLFDRHPQIAALADGGYVVTWFGHTSDGQGDDIFVQRFDAQGAAAGDMARLQGMAGGLFDGHPQIAALAGGGYAVTWRGDTSDGQGSDIFVQSFDAQGAAAGEMVRLQGMAGNLWDGHPQVTALAGGGYAVTWYGDTPDGQGKDVFVQRFDAQGRPLTPTSEGLPAITGKAWAGEVLQAVTWAIGDDDGNGFAYQWHADGVAIAGATGASYTPGPADIGKTLTVEISYHDIQGQPKQVASPATAPVDYGVEVRSGTSFVLPENGHTLRLILTGTGDSDGTGNSLDNLIEGNAGDNHLQGGAGNDTLVGGAGHDRLEGGEGNNRLAGDDGNDTLIGGDGNDVLIGGAGDDIIFGGLTAADLRDVIYGGDGNDFIYGGYGNDELHGDAGNDTLLGSFGSDTLIGHAGDDWLSGGPLSDMLYGGPGDDTLDGGFGHDRMNGGAGADRFRHEGIPDHGSDWIQDYNAAEGDVLWLALGGASRSEFQVNFANTPGAGQAGVEEAFVIYKPTGQILWALVDGAAQAQINILIGGKTYDLLA